MTDLVNRIEPALSAALKQITLDQNADGSFTSLSSAQLDFQNHTTYQTTFFTSLILAALANRRDNDTTKVKAVTEQYQDIKKVQQKAAGFLLSEKSSTGSFNYWSRQSPEFSNLPYPDDLDDTFCALGALASFDSKLITGQILAQAVNILTTQEVEPGGPYRTWLVNAGAPAVWRDVDLAVNCNVAWFLSQQRVTLPGLNRFIEDQVRQNNYRSPYYFSAYPLVYFTARTVGKLFPEPIIEFALNPVNAPQNLLDTALVTAALLYTNVDPKKLESLVKHIIEEYDRCGWQPYRFCMDPAQKGEKYFAGSASLTAAFCFEALNRYQLAQQQSSISVKIDSQAQKIYHDVVNNVQQSFRRLPKDLQQDALLELSHTIKRDYNKEIILLPHLFNQALTKPQSNLDLITSLGTANLYGWMAYTIYDNILDEAKQIELLPLANICLQQVCSIYYGDSQLAKFQPLFDEVMQKIEAANFWELKHTRVVCRNDQIDLPAALPDYKDYQLLADKSFGHALGPLAVLSSLGYSNDSAEMKTAINMFRHYLIARQLNDDAHDWHDDLKNGQLNSVAVMVLQHPEASNQLSQLQQLFWNETIHHVSALIKHHIDQARQSRKQLPILQDDAWLEAILQPLERAATMADEESTKAKDFLAIYGNSKGV